MAVLVAEIVLDKLASAAFQEIQLAIELRSDLEKLKTTMLNIKGVLLDAEEFQLLSNTENHELSTWLTLLRDAFYSSENVVDEFECEALRRQVVKTHGSTFRKVRRYISPSNPLVFRFRLAHKIHNTRKIFEEIAKHKSYFLKKKYRRYDYDDTLRIMKTTEMHSQLPADSEIISRDTDKELIINWLLQSNSDNGNISVIPIVGFGGIGKSMLVKLVYNDFRVFNHFDLRMWVSVKQDFSVTRLTRKILSCAMNDAVNESLSLSQLRKRLQSSLTGKRFLLVLDDVWNCDLSKWIELKGFLTVAAKSSKIIVTTCNHSVASIMGTIEAYTVKNLSDEECFSLIISYAFRHEEEADQYPNLKEIGKEIAKKCGGVPLAAKNLGCLLYQKKDESAWKFLRDNDIWDIQQNDRDMFSGLRSRYNQMTSYLKQCFVYSSFFPKGYKMDAIILIQLWMALGALQSTIQHQEMEDIGESHFKELCTRSFFQNVSANASIWDVIHHSFEMNVIIHDLAFSISKNWRSILGFDTYVSEYGTVRHLSFSKHGQDTLQGFEKENNVISVVICNERRVSLIHIDKSFLSKCISRFKYLRVFDLSHSSFEELPNSIGDLKHLRYLDLSENDKIKKLPNSICNLQSLQTLLLGGCKELEQLPKDLRMLISLRFFVLTTKQACLCDGIGQLESLRFLGIKECSNLISLLNDMKGLAKLRTLLITKCEKLDLKSESKSNQAVELMSLQRLILCDLPSMLALPQWLQANADTLEELYIERCPNLATLPDWLPNLKSLKILAIRDCPKLSSLPDVIQRLSSSMDMQVENCPCLYGIGKVSDNN